MTLLLGHRGDPAHHPENTLDGFAAALRCGADGVELDVQVSADGEPVVIHDATLERTTEGRGAVDAHTWPELRDLGVPHLRDALALLRGHHVAVELKPGYDAHPDLAARVLDCARAAAQDGLLLLSFDHRHLAAAKACLPHIQCGALLRERPPDARAVLRECGADLLAAWWEWVDAPLVQGLDGAVIAWTVDDPHHAAHLAALGVHAVISNDPCALRPVVR